MKRRGWAGLLSLVMMLSLLPTALAAEEGSPLQVLMIGNSHTVDMTEWTGLVLKDSGLEDQVNITMLAPMGGRKLFTDDTARSSHITAATWTGTEDEWNATHQDSGRDVGSKKSQYDKLLNNSDRTWDLIVVQDWEESTMNSDSAAVAKGIQSAVQWLRSCSSVTENTKIAWAADWPDAANHAGAQGNMIGAIAAVNALTEDGVDFIIPTGLTVENARTSYFDKVNNADDSYLLGSEETYGGITNVAKYHLMERDANHLSYELGCYSVAAVTIAEIAQQFGLMDLDAFLTSLKTAPERTNPAEWKGTFNDNIWAIVKESVKNAVEYPTQVTQSVYTEDPADMIAAQILAADYTESAAAAAKADSEDTLRTIAEAVKATAQAATGEAAALSVSSTYTAPVNGTEDNKTGTVGKYEIKVSFLNGYTQKNLAVISGAIKPDYYEGGEEELAAAKTAAAADLARTAALVGKDAEAYSSEINAAYSTNDVDTALAAAKAAMVADAGYLYADWIGADGWTVGTKMPLGEDTGVRFTIREEGADTVLTISGSGKIPDLVMKGESTRSYTSPVWMNDDVSGKITKVIIEDGVALGHMSLWLSRVKTMEIGENVTLPTNAIYLNGQNCDRTITFKGTATVSNRAIDGYTGSDGKGSQAAQNAQVFVYADFEKLGVSRAESFVGSTVLKNNNYGLPIVVVINTGSSVEPEDTILAQGDVPKNGWQKDGTPYEGGNSGVTYTIKKIGDEVVLEFSGSGTIPTFTTETPYYQKTPWWGTNSGSAVTKVIVNSGVTVGGLALYIPTAKEIILKDGVTLKPNAIYFNTQNVDTEITFEGAATVSSGSISWYSDGNQKDKAVQITVTADFSKLEKSGNRVTKASDFIDSGLLTTTNKNGLPIVVAVNTEDSKADAQEFDITTGGWDENGKTVGDSTGIKYKIYTVGADTIVEFRGSGTMPNYAATGVTNQNLSTNRMPWQNDQVTKIIVRDGVQPGQMSLFDRGNSNVREIVFEGNVNLQRNTIYFNTLTQDVSIFFNGTQAQLESGALDGYGVGTAHHIYVYAKSGTLTVGDNKVTTINDFAGSGVIGNHTDGKTIALLVLDDQLSAAKSAVNTSEIIALTGTCQQNTVDGKTAAVKAYVESKLNEKYPSVTVSVAQKSAAIYTVTLSADEQSTSFDLKFTFTFSHSWSYTASSATITAECAHCHDKQAARLIVSDQKETGNAIEATVSYGTAWPGATLTVSYTKDGAPFDGMPKDAGSYAASMEISGATATVNFTISHALTHHEKVAATCTENGVKEYWTCSVCNDKFSDTQGKNEIADFDTWKADAGKIPATGHDMSKTEAVAATCTENGVKEYWTCSTCHKNFSDEQGKTEISDLDAWKADAGKIPVTKHDWSNHDGICKVCKTPCGEAHQPGTTCSVCHKYTSYPYVPGAPTYPATAPAAPNGTVTVSPANASKGTNVTVTVKPNEGYELGSLAVKDANGNLLQLADLGNGKFGFVMPASKVSVEANFVKSAVSTGFADVPANAFFADAVKWAVDKGVTNGLTETMFGPYDPCTRGQIITFLWRAAGSPEPKTAVSFADVPAGSYYAKAVAWAIENGITNGMTETTFAPDATCTRGQGVTFLYRALKGSAGATSSFVDVPTNAFYADAVGWAVSGKVTDGTSNTTFSPDDNCTRGQIVTFLYRAYQGK